MTSNNTILSQKENIDSQKPKKIRCWELDFMRGFAILMVLLDHTMYDIANIFGNDWRISDSTILKQLYNLADWYTGSELRAVGWMFFVFVFFCVSGICTSLSRSNIKRGIKLVLVAGLISVVTLIIQEVFGVANTFIWIGVIHCLSFVVMFYAIVQLVVTLICKDKEKYQLVMLAVTAVILVAGIILNSIFNVRLYDMAYYQDAKEYTSFIAGIFVYTEDAWISANLDYFPVLAFLCMFLCGAIVGQLAYQKHASLTPKLAFKWTKPISFCGKHSLFIYLAIQVAMLPLLFIITYLATGSGGGI